MKKLSGGKHRLPKPRVRTRHLSSVGKSAYAGGGGAAVPAFPTAPGGAAFPPAPMPPAGGDTMAPGAGGPDSTPMMGPGGPGM